jgi:hypothetical protein
LEVPHFHPGPQHRLSKRLSTFRRDSEKSLIPIKSCLDKGGE